MIPFAIPAALNHLLNQEPWAREQLLVHAGKTACIDAGLIAVRLKVAGDGMLQDAGADDAANVTIRVALADLPLILQNRERAFSYVKIEGDADFANTISKVSQSLRWEAEEDLSKVVGDIAATRLVAGARRTFEGARSLHRKLAENTAEYLLEENPVLVRAEAVQGFAADVARLRDDTERLAKRLEKLAGGKPGGAA
jgi:ubiquinone biosynthesis protein UbiJ